MDQQLPKKSYKRLIVFGVFFVVVVGFFVGPFQTRVDLPDIDDTHLQLTDYDNGLSTADNGYMLLVDYFQNNIGSVYDEDTLFSRTILKNFDGTQDKSLYGFIKILSGSDGSISTDIQKHVDYYNTQYLGQNEQLLDKKMNEINQILARDLKRQFPLDDFSKNIDTQIASFRSYSRIVLYIGSLECVAGKTASCLKKIEHVLRLTQKLDMMAGNTFLNYSILSFVYNSIYYTLGALLINADSIGPREAKVLNILLEKYDHNNQSDRMVSGLKAGYYQFVRLLDDFAVGASVFQFPPMFNYSFVKSSLFDKEQSIIILKNYVSLFIDCLTTGGRDNCEQDSTVFYNTILSSKSIGVLGLYQSNGLGLAVLSTNLLASNSLPGIEIIIKNKETLIEKLKQKTEQ